MSISYKATEKCKTLDKFIEEEEDDKPTISSVKNNPKKQRKKSKH